MITLIVGLSVRAMVESAVNSGYNVIALDAFGDQDTKALTEAYSLSRDFNLPYSPAALLEASHSIACDKIAYTANMENYPHVLELWSQAHPVIGNAASSVRSVRCWKTLFPDLRSKGFFAPDTFVDLKDFRKDSGCRWLAKPIRGGGGHGIYFWRGADLSDQHMLQEYIPGKSCSACFLADGSHCIILGLTEQLTGMPKFRSRGFQYCGSLLPLPELLDPEIGPRIYRQVQSVAEFLTRRYGLVGLNGMDFILSKDQVYTIEVNPRYSASMELIERAYDLPMFHLHAEAVCRRNLPGFSMMERVSKTSFWGKAVLFAGRTVHAPDTQTWASRDIRDIPAPGEKLPKGSPICTMLATRSTRDETVDYLLLTAAALENEIYG